MLQVNKMREEVPVVLNVVKDSGWCYSFGLVSVVAFIPVFTFQCYEAWKDRKEGWHKISFHLMGLIALSGNGFWMVSDVFFHDYYRKYARWIFFSSLFFMALYVICAIGQARKEKKVSSRMMSVSKETKSIIFVHSKLAHLRRPTGEYHRMIAVRNRPGKR